MQNIWTWKVWLIWKCEMREKREERKKVGVCERSESIEKYRHWKIPNDTYRKFSTWKVFKYNLRHVPTCVWDWERGGREGGGGGTGLAVRLSLIPILMAGIPAVLSMRCSSVMAFLLHLINPSNPFAVEQAALVDHRILTKKNLSSTDIFPWERPTCCCTLNSLHFFGVFPLLLNIQSRVHPFI